MGAYSCVAIFVWSRNKKGINFYKLIPFVRVDPQGFEPQMTEPKSVVLPLHHGSVFLSAKLDNLF